MFDWDAKVYWNRTENDQIKTGHTSTTAIRLLRRRARQCGLRLYRHNRGYLLDTVGIDVYNTTRFDICDWRHAVTYGLDAFQDKVTTSDLRGTSDVTTPGGQRTVSGGFVQWKANYTSCSRWSARSVTTITSWNRGDDVRRGGDRLSPKITVGLMPVAVLDALCQLCRRLPRASITETLVNGPHAGAAVNARSSAVRRARRDPVPIRHSASCPIRTCGPRSARTRRSAST